MCLLKWHQHCTFNIRSKEKAGKHSSAFAISNKVESSSNQLCSHSFFHSFIHSFLIQLWGSKKVAGLIPMPGACVSALLHPPSPETCIPTTTPKCCWEALRENGWMNGRNQQTLKAAEILQTQLTLFYFSQPSVCFPWDQRAGGVTQKIVSRLIASHHRPKL